MASSGSLTNDEIRRRIQNIWIKFVKGVEPDPLSDWLIQEHVITSDQWQSLYNDHSTKQSRSRALLHHLFSIPHPRAFLVVYQALAADSHFLRDSIDNQEPGHAISSQEDAQIPSEEPPEPNQQRATGNVYEEVELMTGVASTEYLPINVEQLQQNNEQLRKDNEQLRKDNEQLRKDNEQLRKDNEQQQVNHEQLRKDNERLVAKVNELKQHRYTGDNILYGTASGPVHTIKTKASERENEKEKAPINGIAIMENNLFVINKNSREIEVYDAKTFVFERLIQNQPFENPIDIAASTEDKSLYIFNRIDEQSKSEIVKFDFAGDGVMAWVTENDDGRLSTYTSNLIVCLSTKRIIIEYSPDGKIVNTVRLSPGNGFKGLMHALKLSGIHFAVSHSNEDGGEKVCVVDINGSVLTTFDELPGLKYIMTYSHFPICLAEGSEESVLVADARHKRVILLNSKLRFVDVLIETNNQIPVRLCLNETRERVFVGVNSGDRFSHETWKSGRILIYNIRK